MLKTVRPLLLPLMFGLMALPAMAGDLEQPMKKIGFNYKQAVKADDAATMEKYIKEMKAQLDVAKGKNRIVSSAKHPPVTPTIAQLDQRSSSTAPSTTCNRYSAMNGSVALGMHT